MVWKVVKDATWRMWALALMTCSLVAVLWLTVGSDGGIATSTAFAASMAFTFIQGPFVGFTLFGQKEFIYLPLSRRQLWRARLTVALIVPVIFMLAAKLAALAAASILAIGGTLTVGTILLSSFYDFAYAGAGLGLLACSGIGRTHRQIFGERTLRSALLMVSVLIVAMGPGWPLLFRTALPTEWNQLSRGAWFLMAVGLGIAVATFFHSPKLAHAGRWSGGAGGRRETGALPGTSNPVIGIARLMWPEVALRLGCVVVLLPVFWFVASQTDDTLVAVWGLLLISLSASPSPATRGVPAALRPLRALPISARTLTAVLAAQPLVTCCFIWMLLAAARTAFGSHMPTLTTGMLLWLVGIASVTQGVGLALTGSRFFRLGTVLPVMLGWFLAVFAARFRIGLPVHLQGLSVALGGVTAGAWLTFRALRRNSSVYRSSAAVSMSAMQEPSA